jgi:hypothetical protein
MLVEQMPFVENVQDKTSLEQMLLEQMPLEQMLL